MKVVNKFYVSGGRLKLIVVIIILLSTGLYFYLNQPKTKPPAEVFMGMSGTPEYFKDLLTRAKKQDPEAYEEALLRAEKGNSRTKEAAAESLSYYEDEKALNSLEKLFLDPNERVRIRAIKAISNLQSEERKNILLDFYHKDQFSDREEVHLWSSLLRVSKEKEISDLALEHLIYLLKNSKEEKVQALSVSYMIHYLPKNNQIIETFEDYIQDYKYNTPLANIIRFLGSKKNSIYMDNMKNLVDVGSFDVHLSIIETLHLSCPKNRKEVLKKIILLYLTKSRELKSLTRTLSYHGELGKNIAEELGIIAEREFRQDMCSHY